MEFPKRIGIIIGLGNPGKEYAETYHNTGFLAVHALAAGASFSRIPKKHFAYAKRNGFIFVQPLVFMNISGIAAKNALGYFKTSPDAMLVAHDDSDLAAGRWKLDFGRGAAGHRGVASIIEALGTKNFWRLRIGVRGKNEKRPPRRIKAGDFVLRKITSEDQNLIHFAIDGFTTKFTENVTP